MFYNIYQGGGGLGLLRPAGIHRRHQGGPAAAQLVERGKLGGVFGASKRETPTTSRSRVAFAIINKEQGAYLKLISVVGANTNSLPVRKRSSTSPDSERLSPSGCSPLLHFQEPTTIPSRPTMVYEDHRRRLRLIHRVSAHRKRAPEIVDERPALLGMNRAMLRNLAGPRPARRAQRTHWRRMFGAQVDSNPSHRCPSHVRLSPALVSAPPHVPVRPFVWGCGS